MAGVVVYRDEERKQSQSLVAVWEEAIMKLVGASSASDAKECQTSLDAALSEARFAAVETHQRAFQSRIVKIGGGKRFSAAKVSRWLKWCLVVDCPSPRAATKRLSSLDIRRERAVAMCQPDSNGPHLEAGFDMWTGAYDDAVRLSEELGWGRIHAGKAAGTATAAIVTLGAAGGVVFGVWHSLF